MNAVRESFLEVVQSLHTQAVEKFTSAEFPRDTDGADYTSYLKMESVVNSHSSHK